MDTLLYLCLSGQRSGRFSIPDIYPQGSKVCVPNIYPVGLLWLRPDVGLPNNYPAEMSGTLLVVCDWVHQLLVWWS